MSASTTPRTALAYVANLTEQAALSSSNATDIAGPLQDQISRIPPGLGSPLG